MVNGWHYKTVRFYLPGVGLGSIAGWQILADRSVDAECHWIREYSLVVLSLKVCHRRGDSRDVIVGKALRWWNRPEWTSRVPDDAESFVDEWTPAV